MENIWICVYHDTIEQHDKSENLTKVLVTKEFAKQYFNERIARGEYNKLTFEDFLDEYTADWTVDFYRYAMNHNAVIQTENW